MRGCTQHAKPTQAMAVAFRVTPIAWAMAVALRSCASSRTPLIIIAVGTICRNEVRFLSKAVEKRTDQ
jgi:hypothetical protein